MPTSEQLTDGQPVSSWDYWLARHHWLPYVLPFAVYMLVGSCEPHRPSSDPQDPVAVTAAEATQDRVPGSIDKPPQGWGRLGYPVIYTIQIGATLLAMLLVRSGLSKCPVATEPARGRVRRRGRTALDRRLSLRAWRSGCGP